MFCIKPLCFDIWFAIFICLFVTSKSGGGLTFQKLVMRATNGVLNCHSGKISGKTVPRHVQPEQIWVHAVVQQNSETSPKDHDKQEKGFAKFRPNCIKRNGTS